MATRTISTKLAVEGESQYKQAIKNINSELSTLDSRLKLVQSEFSGQQNTMEALRAKAKALAEVQAAQAEKVNTLKEAYNNAKSALDEYASKNESLKQSLTQNEEALAKLSDETKSAGTQWNDYKQKLAEAENKLKELKNATGDTADEQNELEKEITETKAAMAKLEEETDGAASAAGDLLRENKELNSELQTNEAYLDSAQRATNNWEKQLNTAQVKLNQTNAEIEKNEKYLDEASKAADGCATSIDEMGKEAKEAGDQGTQAFKSMSEAVTALGLIEGVKKLAESLKSCVDVAADFQYQMATVKSLSGATGEEFDSLTSRAKTLGATTSFTATQAGEAMEYMALAGWNTKDMLEGVNGVMALAAAATMDLGTASDIVTDNLTAFNMTAKDSNRFADQLAYAMSKSNTNVEQLGESYKYCAATSTQLGYSMEDTTAALMVMANAGIKGSSSGTALASIMTRLGNDVSDCRTMLRGYGIEVYDTTGKARALSEILDDMKGIWEKLTDEEKSALAYTVAGKTAQAQLMTVLGESTGAFEEYAEGLRNCNGAAKEMQDIKLDTFTGQLQLLVSAYDGLRVSIGEDLMPVLGVLVEGMTSVLTVMNELVEENPGITAAIVGITTAMAAFAIGAVATSEVVTGTLVPALLAAFSNPVILAIAAIGALVAALVTLEANTEDVNAATKQMRKEAEEAAQAVREEQEAFEELNEEMAKTAKSNKSLVDELDELRKKTELSAAEHERLLHIIQKLNEEFPELGLIYDEATGSINMTTDAIRKFVDVAEKEEEATAIAARYNEILDERAQKEEELKRAEEELAQAQAEHAEAMELWQNATTNILKWSGLAQETRERCEEAEIAVDALKTAISDLEIEEDGLREYLEASNSEMGETEGVSQAANTAIELMIAQMENLNQAYNDEYDAAYKSISGQFNLWDELDKVVATSAADIKAALESQTEYWTSYAENLSNLNGRNIEGLNEFVAQVDDGSSKAASYIAGLAEMSDEELMKLVNETYPALKEAQDQAAQGTVDMKLSYMENMTAIAEETGEAVKKMNLSAEANQAAADTMQGYINGLKETSPTKEMEEAAKQATESFKNKLGVHSPSTVFEEIGNNTMQGYAQGVSKNQNLVVTELEKVAKQLTEKAKTTLGAEAWQEIGKVTMTGLQSGISACKPDAVKTMGNASDETLNKAKTILKTEVFQEIGRGTMTGLQNGIDSGKPNAVNAMQSAANTVYNTAKTALSGDKFKEIGTGITDGIAAGVLDGIPSIEDAAKKAAKAAYEAAKKELDINSPSKKFEYLADMSIEGYTGRWSESAGDIDRLIRQTLSLDYEQNRRGTNILQDERTPITVYQEIHIHAKTDSLSDTVRAFEDSQREAATEW